MLDLVNRERQARGLRPLTDDGPLADTSVSWSAKMARDGRLSHHPDLRAVASQVEPQWRAVAENVGYAGSIERVHELLMQSTDHRNNILSSNMNRIGIGVVHSGGRVWVTQRFLQGPDISGPRTIAATDLDGDGADDLLVHGPGSAPDEVLRGSGRRTFSHASTTIRGDYVLVTGDFNGSGEDSVLFYAAGGAADYLSQWNGSGFSSLRVTINGTYIPSVGDLDGDGRDDIIWYAPGGAADYIWYGTATDGKFVSQRITVNGVYELIVADLDGNGQDDLTWYAPGSAADYIHMRTGTRTFKSIRTTINGRYEPTSGDYDGDGQDDIMWHGPGGAADYVWYGKAKFGSYQSVRVTVNGRYQPVSGDFDDDGRSDIVWTDGSNVDGVPIWYGRSTRGKFDDGRV